MFLWILGAKRSLWLTQMFLETKSLKNMNPPNESGYSKPTARRLFLGGMSKWTSKFNLRTLWMVVFYVLVLPKIACPHTLSRIYLQTWFWGTHGVMKIV